LPSSAAKGKKCDRKQFEEKKKPTAQEIRGGANLSNEDKGGRVKKELQAQGQRGYTHARPQRKKARVVKENEAEMHARNNTLGTEGDERSRENENRAPKLMRQRIEAELLRCLSSRQYA